LTDFSITAQYYISALLNKYTASNSEADLKDAYRIHQMLKSHLISSDDDFTLFNNCHVKTAEYI
jgi:hypothetical protein